MADVEADGFYIPEQVVDGYLIFIEGNGYWRGHDLLIDFSLYDEYGTYGHTEYIELNGLLLI